MEALLTYGRPLRLSVHLEYSTQETTAFPCQIQIGNVDFERKKGSLSANPDHQWTAAWQKIIRELLC